MRDHLRPAFRSAPHVSGTAQLKPRDYEPAETVEAASPYAAFLDMRSSGTPLEVGDVLEDERGMFRVCKFVGFEEAHFMVPEARPLIDVTPEVAPADLTSVGAGALE
ncbi:MAG: hypothetical protein LAO79_18390 [Acidobacteriia bacterium]|nr:hypothetical protein [Terriglobia bacterium]